MTDRPTPEEIGQAVIDDHSWLPESETQDDIAHYVVCIVQAERAEADRRVAEAEKKAAEFIRLAVDPENGWHNGLDVFEAVNELARDIERGEHRK